MLQSTTRSNASYGKNGTIGCQPASIHSLRQDDNDVQHTWRYVTGFCQHGLELHPQLFAMDFENVKFFRKLIHPVQNLASVNPISLKCLKIASTTKVLMVLKIQMPRMLDQV